MLIQVKKPQTQVQIVYSNNKCFTNVVSLVLWNISSNINIIELYELVKKINDESFSEKKTYQWMHC